ncbi:MAG: PEP-utilizing enzyme, partial [Candidatus Micrarchaeota archaeon]
DKYTRSDLTRLVEKWSWQGEYSLQEDLFDKVYFEEQIKQSANIDDKIVDKIKENKKAFEETLKTLDANTQKLAQIVNKYVVLRTHRIDIVKKFLVNMRQFYIHLTKLLQGKGFTYNEIINLTRREIVDFLEKNIIPNLSDTKKRVNGEVAYLYKGKVEFISITKLETQETRAPNVSLTKGKPANGGTATGPAVIVKTKSDLLKVRSGCVLVAQTTYPEYTPFMKKAVAIVTDEGGVTSHAAIVARELGIPCIVGTKNATKIFTDNELIIVNADKGTVEKT